MACVTNQGHNRHGGCPTTNSNHFRLHPCGRTANSNSNARSCSRASSRATIATTTFFVGLPWCHACPSPCCAWVATTKSICAVCGGTGTAGCGMAQHGSCRGTRRWRAAEAFVMQLCCNGIKVKAWYTKGKESSQEGEDASKC